MFLIKPSHATLQGNYPVYIFFVSAMYVFMPD